MLNMPLIVHLVTHFSLTGFEGGSKCIIRLHWYVDALTSGHSQA